VIGVIKSLPKGKRPVNAAKVKEWRKAHPEQWREQRNCIKARDKMLTGALSFLEAHKTLCRWTNKEIKFLEQNSKEKTIIDIAIALGRTYDAVACKAHREDITLFTEEKRRGKLITGQGEWYSGASQV